MVEVVGGPRGQIAPMDYHHGPRQRSSARMKRQRPGLRRKLLWTRVRVA